MKPPSIDPDLDAGFKVAIRLRDTGQLAEAKRALDNLSKCFPSAYGVWLILGGVEMSLFDYEAAERAFTMALSIRPNAELASLGMFHTLKHLGRIGEAFAEMRRFLLLRPESSEYEYLRNELAEAERPDFDSGE